MPHHKFGDNDIFYNTVKSYPKYIFTYYFNNAYINNRNFQGDNVHHGRLYLHEINVNRPNSLITGSLNKGENNNFVFDNVTSSYEYKVIDQGQEMSMPYPLFAAIDRDLIIARKDAGNNIGVDIRQGVTYKRTVFKMMSLGNRFNEYIPMSKHYDFNKYIMMSGGIPPTTKGSTQKVLSQVNHYQPYGLTSKTYLNTLTESIPMSDYINLISIPSIFYGSEIKKGSIDLKFYFSGSLIGQAQDKNKNGEIIEVSGTRVGDVLGVALYKEGMIVLTASHPLHNTYDMDGYLSPVTGTTLTSVVAADGAVIVGLDSSWKDRPRWSHFGAYQSFIKPSDGGVSASFAPASSSYVLEFQGTTTTPTITMMAHAEKNELNWSNNPTFLDRDGLATTHVSSFVAQTGSKIYKEKDLIQIKNTVSSSYCGFTASYKSQTFISKIGVYDENKELIAVAKLATPVKKTNEQDYTFKLKLDL
jgi:hypothetical protein